MKSYTNYIKENSEYDELSEFFDINNLEIIFNFIKNPAFILFVKIDSDDTRSKIQLHYKKNSKKRYSGDCKFTLSRKDVLLYSRDYKNRFKTNTIWKYFENILNMKLQTISDMSEERFDNFITNNLS